MKSKDLKPAFRDGLKKFIAETRQNESLEKYGDIQRSIVFTEFYIKRVLQVLAPHSTPFDEDDLSRSITDAPRDLGVDLLYRDNGRVLIIQTKYHKLGHTEDPAEFSRFCDTIDRLHKASQGKIKANHRLRSLVSDIDWNNDYFDLQFICLAKGCPEIQEREDAGQLPISTIDNIEDRVSIKFKGETKLNIEFRSATDSADRIAEPVDILLTEAQGDSPWLKHVSSQGRVSYVGMISGRQIYQLVERFPSKLFNFNIRDFLGDITTNRAIVSTAQKNPADFFFFNNGISAVATGIEERLEEGILQCDDFSIINGAQTATSIWKAFRANNSRIAGEVEVLLRISVIDYQGDLEDGGFLDLTTKFNNTQNVVKVSDFRSNDQVQKDLRRHFKSLTLKGKPFWYKNKRTQERKPNTYSIGMDVFTHTIHAFSYGPADYFGGTSYLFDAGPEKGYVKVFGSEKGMWDGVVDEEFQRLAGIWFLCQVIRDHYLEEREYRLKKEDEQKQKGQDIEPIAQHALERKWLVYFTVGEVLRQKYKQPGEFDVLLRKLYKPDWTYANSQRVEAVQAITRFAVDILLRLYRSESKRVDFNHRNFYRHSKYLDAIKLEVSDAESTVGFMPQL